MEANCYAVVRIGANENELNEIDRTFPKEDRLKAIDHLKVLRNRVQGTFRLYHAFRQPSKECLRTDVALLWIARKEDGTPI